MIPVTQTKVNVKNSKGETVVYGNCFAAVIASIMEVPIDEVPNVEVFFHINDITWIQVMDMWLKSKGWEHSGDDRYKCFHRDIDAEMDIETANNYMMLKDNYYFVVGKSPRGINHVCIYQNGVMVWDPHPTKEGLVTVEYFESLERIKEN